MEIAMSKYDPESDEAVLTKNDKKEKLDEPPKYKVLLHNDDFTTQDFVVFVLQKIFNHPLEEAIHRMYQVHFQGLTIGGVYPYEIAETKANKVIRLARERDFPFMCSLEKE